MIEIFGRNNSINVQKVMWCAAELGLEVKRLDIGGAFGGTDTEEFQQINPNAKIPALRHGDFCLWESNAIVRYLCEAFPKDDWLPDSLTARGHVHQWMDWYLTTMHPPMTTVFWQLIRTAPEARDADKLAAATRASAALWAQLDQHLEGRDYLLGERLTMADIPLGCSVYRWHELAADPQMHPHVSRWYQRLAARPAFQAQVMLPLT